MRHFEIHHIIRDTGNMSSPSGNATSSESPPSSDSPPSSTSPSSPSSSSPPSKDSPPPSPPQDSTPPPSNNNSSQSPPSGNNSSGNNGNNNNNNNNNNGGSNGNNNSSSSSNNNSNNSNSNNNNNNSSSNSSSNNSSSNSNNNDNNNSNNGDHSSSNSSKSPSSSSNDKSPSTPTAIISSADHYAPPPPPTHHSGALSPPHKSTPSSSPSSSDGVNEKAIIAGVAAGAGLMLIIMIVFLVCCCKKKKRRNPHDEYYRGHSHGTKNNIDYYNTGHYNTDHHLKMPPGKGVSAEYGGWGAPPPPPAMANSTDMSSAAFSGPYQPAMPPPHPSLALGFNQSTFSYEDLNAATGGFIKENLLGQGGFGYVHKGVLPNGKEVAVKSLKSGSGQGEREFQAEVDIISRVHHRHLVSLVGYCITGSQRMLVYEYVSNNTLEFHLHGKDNPVMDWPARLRIALGSAKGFAYLHEDCHPRIIHRDIKASNILLDDHFEAKVSDFGLAKLSNDTNTHVSTRIMGTFGYLAPEYASSGKLTEKSDVYSYGVVLLELIAGRRPVDYTSDDEDTLIDWARPILMRASEGGSYEELVDPRLEHNYDPQEMLRMVASAAACIRHSARRRPKMSQIVRALEGDVSLEDLNEGVKPGHSTVFGSGSSSSDHYDGQTYNADIKKFRQIAFASTEFSSGEHGVTSDYGHSSSGGESQEMKNRKQNP